MVRTREAPVKKFVSTIALAVAVVVLGLSPAPAAEASSCTTVWITNPSYYGKFAAGSRLCLNIGGTSWAPIHQGGELVDYANPYAVTTDPPNTGRVQSTATTIRAIARKNSVSLQFSSRDLSGRMGCSGEFHDSVSGTYQPSSRHPGKGLVRIGTGVGTRCMADRSTAINAAKHEISHGIVDRKCGTSRPKIAGGRSENVTDAYAYRYLGASRAAGNYGFTHEDLRVAMKIRVGDC